MTTIPEPSAQPDGLRIPEIPDSASALDAALAYAAAGFYVGPLDVNALDAHDRKNPGKVFGKGWPAKTTRDPQEIAAIWAGTDYGVFLHAGRSGAVVVDLDSPELLPAGLAEALVVLVG